MYHFLICLMLHWAFYKPVLSTDSIQSLFSSISVHHAVNNQQKSTKSLTHSTLLGTVILGSSTLKTRSRKLSCDVLLHVDMTALSSLPICQNTSMLPFSCSTTSQRFFWIQRRRGPHSSLHSIVKFTKPV